MRHMTVTIVAILALALSVAHSASAQEAGGLNLTINPADAAIGLGEMVDFEVTVTNSTSTPTNDLVIHIDVTDPAGSTSVDPEDWTSTLTKRIGVIDAGASQTVGWRIQPISGGTFSVYAVALSADTASIAASDALLVTVSEQRSLNPNGVLPVVLAMPLVIGALLAVQQWSSRRTGRV